MKKINKIIICLLFFIIFIPIVKADGIENYYINATVLNNGDIEVEEYFNLTGVYNGFERILKYKSNETKEFDSSLQEFGPSKIYNGSNIELISIKAVDKDSNFDFTNIEGIDFKKVSSASNGDYAKYTVSSTYGGYSYLIYLPSSKNKAFYLKYVIKDVAVLHNDVGEVYLNIFTNELREDVDNLIVTLNVNNNTNLRVWAHGPLTGDVENKDNTKLVATMYNLKAYQALDIRATFDTSVISSSSKKTNVDALDKIIAYEEIQAEKANKERIELYGTIEEKAKLALEDCEEYPTYYCYQNALEKINKITNIEKRKEYLERLDVLLPGIIDNMVELANYYIDIAVDNPTFKNYRIARSYVNDIPECSQKEELLQKIVTLEILVKTKEKEKCTKDIIYTSLIIIGICLLSYRTYLKYRKQYKTDFNAKYLREIPENLSPTTLSYLLDKKITDKSISALILKLINDKAIEYEKLDNDYKLINKSSDKSLSTEEELLIKFIFTSGDEITLKQLKKNARKNYTSTRSNFKKFKDEALKQATEENYYKKDPKNKTFNDLFKWGLALPFISLFLFFPTIIIVLPISIVMVLIGTIKLFTNKEIVFTPRRVNMLICDLLVIFEIINLSYLYFTIFYYHKPLWINVIAILVALICHFIVKRLDIVTQNGVDSLAKWNSLRNFFNDFSRFDEKELPEVKLWKSFLVYATVMGCAKKLAKKMNLKVADLKEYNENFVEIATACYVGNKISATAIKATKIADRAYNIANSSSYSSSGGGHYSSGRGHGGGFSSGGGHGGGGGGGGRF